MLAWLAPALTALALLAEAASRRAHPGWLGSASVVVTVVAVAAMLWLAVRLGAMLAHRDQDTRQSVARYRQIVDTAQEGVLMLDTDSTISVVNQRAADIPSTRRWRCAEWTRPGWHLEITEGVLMDDVAFSLEALTALRRTGVMISIDDFGKGYSSLSYLNRFPVDVLKIDQSFVAGLPDDAYDVALVQAVLAIADALHLSVVAEGVENAAQAEMLGRLGCNRAQGYHFHRPLTAEDFEAELVAGLAMSLADPQARRGSTASAASS